MIEYIQIQTPNRAKFIFPFSPDKIALLSKGFIFGVTLKDLSKAVIVCSWIRNSQKLITDNSQFNTVKSPSHRKIPTFHKINVSEKSKL